MLQGLKWGMACLCYRKKILSAFIIWGVTAMHSALRTWSRVLFRKSPILSLMAPNERSSLWHNSKNLFSTISIHFGTFFKQRKWLIQDENQDSAKVYYVTFPLICYNFFSRQLFSEFLKFIQKSSLVRTLWNFQGVKKVYWKKVIAFFPFPRGRKGGK